VSIATASRALAGKSRVSPETAKLVGDVARRLGYRVDHIARAMRAGTTRTVGMVVPLISNPMFAELIDVVEAELQQHGFELILADSHADVTQEARRLDTLVERRVDGILIVSQDHKLSTAAISRTMANVPVIQLDRALTRLDADFVGVDNDNGMAAIVDHLAELGVSSIALVSANDLNSSGQARRRAFERLTAGRFKVHEPVLDSFDVETGRRASAELVARGVLPDALVAGCDLIALGLIAGLREAGVRVPSDVLVAGFDGIQLTELFDPPLTTVRQPLAAIARDAVSFLIDRLTDPAAASRDNRIRPELVVRESTLGASPRSRRQPVRATPSAHAV
jgi:LacI family transcriptional regulator